jgi:hypothetical protein
MAFDRERLPDPTAYFQGQGLRLIGCGEWRTTACVFHDGSDSMRVNTRTGAFVCMAGCGAKGGDVVAYQMAVHGQGFVEAARQLGAWVADGNPRPVRPRGFSPRDALGCIEEELNVCVIVISDARQGLLPSDDDWRRFLSAASRIGFIAGGAA